VLGLNFKGTLYGDDGSKYSGDWEANQRHGDGINCLLL